jgi:hypothetical protein
MIGHDLFLTDPYQFIIHEVPPYNVVGLYTTYVLRKLEVDRTSLKKGTETEKKLVYCLEKEGLQHNGVC